MAASKELKYHRAYIEKLIVALEACVEELDAYETIRDPLHPQNVALDLGYEALGVPANRQRRWNRP